MALWRCASLVFALFLALGTARCAPREDAARAASPPPTPAAIATPSDDRQRGVCFVAGPPIGTEAFDPLVSSRVTWISQTPFGWQEGAHDPDFRIVTGGRIHWGERDSGLIETARLAHARGLRVLLKPHLWLRDRSNGQWVGSIAMRSEADWARWFTRYEEFIVHYAKVAAAGDMEALCVGTELEGTSRREADWRRVIAAARRVYAGRITYAANWSGEFERVAFWDACDFIGIQAYFPLSSRAEASVDELIAGWRPHAAKIEALQRKFDKPVVFTEVGYKASDRATVEPWLWRTDDRYNPEEQARAYEATFRVFWDEPWFAGMYWWKWFPGGHPELDGHDRRFSPQGKPARAVMQKWYARPGLD